MLDKRREADDKLSETFYRGNPFKCGQAVYRQSVGLEIVNHLFHSDEVIFQTFRLRIDTCDFQFSVRFKLFEIDTPTDRIAKELLPTLFEREHQTSFAVVRPPPRRIH